MTAKWKIMVDAKAPTIIFVVLWSWRKQNGAEIHNTKQRGKANNRKQVLNGTPIRSWESQGTHHRQMEEWTKAYLEKGESGLETKKKPGNPLSR